MRIGIEAQRIFRSKKGGMDVAALEIIKCLQKIDNENQYIIYASRNDGVANMIEESENFRIKYVKAICYVDWEQLWLPYHAHSDSIDVLHCTSNTGPVWVSAPKVTTVHDIIYLEKKSWPKNENLYQRFGNYYRRLIVPVGIKTSKKIITVSEFEKENIINHFKLDRTKIKVIANGVNSVFRKIYDREVLDKTANKYRLPEKFIFFMGNTEPRKNICNLLKAYSILISTISNAPDLVITNLNEGILNKILSRVELKNVRKKIFLTGYADFKDLPALYNLADFFIYPSFREGFGMPILEAMACGTAVITSNVSSMPEVSGNATLLTDPCSPESIAEAMMLYLSDPSLKEEKIQLGLAQYKLYTWEESAKEILKTYNSVLARNYMDDMAVNPA